MRPLDVEPVAKMPECVLGVSLIRGSAVPVVDLGRLLGASAANRVARYVTLRVGERRVAVAVSGVEGIIELAREKIHQLPPLWERADDDVVEGIAIHDRQLVEVLGSTRVVPDGVWAQLDSVELHTDE